MKKSIVFAALCILLVGLSGCGSDPDSLLKDQIKAMDEMADAFEKNQPDSKIEDIKKRLEQTNKELDKLNLSEEDKKKLVEKHKDELMRVSMRLQQAVMSKAMKGMGEGLPGMPKFGKTP